MTSVPFAFRPTEMHKYPSDNHENFEEFFFRAYSEPENKSDREYLPVMWTAFYKNHSYGQDFHANRSLQLFLNELDKSKAYYTIVQYDDSILNDISHLDLKVFSMAGQPMHYGLPLVCQPHEYNFPLLNKDIFYSFIGRPTHKIRAAMIDVVNATQPSKKRYISTMNHSLKDYCHILSKSVYSLSPRGYGPNSFRIMESLQYGAIPVWVSDVFTPIHNLDFNDFGVLIEEKNISRIHEILESIPESEIKRKQSILPDVYYNYFTYEANKKIILENL